MSVRWWLSPGVHETPRMRYRPPLERLWQDLLLGAECVIVRRISPRP